MFAGLGPETAKIQAASTDPTPQFATPPLVLAYVVEERNGEGLAAASGVALVVMFHVRTAPVTESIVK